ncbi:MAG: hypothetical protein L0H73_18310 [Nitrococcus sp.]|nr:hypothetical protein [Nitrococcus sp.]
MSTERRRIVSDTGPLISLEKLTGGFRLISRLYDVVLVPPAVLKELMQGQFESTEAYLVHYNVVDLLEVKDVSSSSVHAKTRHLDEGESQAIQLAIDEELPLLIEEQAGRETAQELGLHVSGIAGQLTRGFREGLISVDEAKGKLDEMLRAGRINIKVHEIVAKAIENEA